MIKAILTDFNYVLWLPGQHGFELNKQFAQFLRELHGTGVEVHILTSGMMAGSPEVQQQIGDFVSKVHYTHKIGKWKSEPALFSDLIEELGYEAEEVLLIDDQETNVTAAKKAGLQAVKYENNQQTMEFITNLT